MREVAFIKQNKEKWLEFEQAIFGKLKKNPDDLASLYIHLVNDLSYAQTYYPKSKTVVYLNHLASQTYQKIYKTKREDTNKLIYFFKTEVPLLVYQYRRYVLYAFLIFGILTAIGTISARNDDTFVRLILGDAYVNMSLENIKDGNPVAVYKSGSNWGSFVGITFNNLRVGALSYFFGIFLGFGTFYILINNCIMLGSFQYFFYREGVFWESVRGIWIHGSMEIFAMVIEAAAGFALGASILFPNTFSRFNSFKIGFKNTFKIFLSTMPFTIVAGFLEGFITRYSINMPHFLSVFIILLTLSAISYYYLIYPFKVHKKINKENVSAI
ncbi:stage II sporulation protein M [uncultured Flavobacterium sp.]|uniref:stage II sporulation protein M n=1 Tax=uncultured Flavobacterium sp. TaxID=165435 RepID=UPI0030EC7223